MSPCLNSVGKDNIQHLMIVLLASITESWNNPQQQHAMLVHMPVAISVLGLIALIVLGITRGRSHPVRWLAAGMYLIAGVTAYMAVQAGYEASQMVKISTPQYQAEYRHHEELGANLWMALLGLSALIALTAIPRKPVRIGLLVISIGMSIWLALWVSETAHHGGALVYVHGAASPQAAGR